MFKKKLDYEKREREWKKMKRSSTSDWERNVEAMVQWSPFSSESDLLKQVRFNLYYINTYFVSLYNLDTNFLFFL